MSDRSLQVNTINVFLIIVSLILAYQFPFELFLLAYAILGPLHYVTEINWLEKKSFFLKEKKQVLMLILLTAVIAIPFALTAYTGTKEVASENALIQFLRLHSATFAFMGLSGALAMILTKQWYVLLLTLAGTFILGWAFEKDFTYSIILGGMVPTIIHVYFFTLLFMLYGALKEKSKIGIISVILMVVVPIVIMYLPLEIKGYRAVNDYFIESYNISGFQNVNYSLGYTLGLTSKQIDYVIFSEIGIKIQVFIAFAYTYHYLNWFSKTTVIGWHKVISKKRLILLLGIWAISVVFYYYSYYAGFLVLLFLSYLHVLLEFPLNWVSIKGIGERLLSVFKK
jgi:hypothetical protein